MVFEIYVSPAKVGDWPTRQPTAVPLSRAPSMTKKEWRNETQNNMTECTTPDNFIYSFHIKTH